MRRAPTDCPGLDALELALAQGPLPAALQSHIDRCPACAQRARQISGNLSFVGSLRQHIAPDSLKTITRQSAPAPEPIPSLPNYRLLRQVARGAQGILYEATQLDTKRRVAVKLVDPGTSEASAARRFRREAELAAALRHPNIVTIYHSAALPDGRLALAMEYVDGPPLDEWAAARDDAADPTPLGRRRALRDKLGALSAICAAVHHAHSQGVVHRDLKPANVLIDADDIPRVVDFGIAKRLSPGTQITRVGGFVGTLAYAAPEQVSGTTETADTRSDVYSLGLLLYEAIAGRRPYDTGSSISEAIESITHREPEPLRVVQPGNQPADPEIEAIVARALAKSPDERYQSAAALRADIENYLAGRPVEARHHSTVYTLKKLAVRHRVAVAAAAIVLTLLAALAASMAWSNRRLGHQQNLLADALARSTIDRARAAIRAGEFAQAEGLLWTQFLAIGADPTDPNILFDSPPLATQAAWALTELNARCPIQLTIPLSEPPSAIDLDPTGRTIRVLSLTAAATRYDAATGRLLDESPPVVPEPARFIRLSTSHAHALLAYRDGPPVAVDLERRTAVTLDDPRLRGRSITDITPSGDRFIAAPRSGVLELWATAPLRLQATLSTAALNRATPTLSHDGRLVLCGETARACIWNSATGALEAAYLIPDSVWDTTARIENSSLRLAADQRRLVIGFHDQLALIDRDAPDAPPTPLGSHSGFVTHIAVATAANRAISSGSESTVKAWNLDAPDEPATTIELDAATSALPDISASGDLLAAAQPDAVRIAHTTPQRWRSTLETAEQTVHVARFSPDGTLLGTTGSSGSVRLYRAADRSLIWATPPRSIPIETLTFSPDSNTLAFTGPDGKIYTLNARSVTAPQPQLLATANPFTTWLVYDPTGRSIVATGSAPDILVIDATTGAITARAKAHSRRSIKAVFSTDGRRLYVAGNDGGVLALDTSDWSALFWTGKDTAQSRALALAPDNRTIAVGADDWSITLCDAQTGTIVRTMTGVRQHVFSLAFHPEGNVLFSCSRDPDVHVWDTRTGTMLARLDGHTDIILSLAISPDGATLATAGVDRTVRLWNLNTYTPHLAGNAAYWRRRTASAASPDRPKDTRPAAQ